MTGWTWVAGKLRLKRERPQVDLPWNLPHRPRRGLQPPAGPGAVSARCIAVKAGLADPARQTGLS